MRAVLRRSVGLLVVLLLASACTSGGPAAKGTTTTTVTNGTAPTSGTLPSLVADATPAGWVPVDYGDAQISVPAGWYADYGDCPFRASPGVVVVGSTPSSCPSDGAGAAPIIYFEPASAVAHTPVVRITVNGIAVSETYRSPGHTNYLVPVLGISLQLVGKDMPDILATLTRAPRAVVLSGGPAPAVPSSWRRDTFAGMTFATPASWPRIPTAGYGGGCLRPGVQALTEVTLSTDQQIEVYHCTIQRGPPLVEPPAAGVRVDEIASRSPVAAAGLSTDCLQLHGLTACPYAQPAFGILYLLVTGPALAHGVMFEIGLVGDGMVARTVLYSLRAA
jgi:hypothetical protein